MACKFGIETPCNECGMCKDINQLKEIVTNGDRIRSMSDEELEELKYKGYVATQTSNKHVMIIKDGRMVMHAQCTKYKDKDELKEMIDLYIKQHGSAKMEQEKKTSEIKLLPCPFCGGEAKLEKENRINIYCVQCEDCKCMTTFQFDFGEGEEISKKKAIEVWNTRKPMERIVERLKEERKEVTRWDSDKHYIYKEGADWMGEKAIEIVKEVGGVDE